jgi:hypothetical protein
MMIEVEERGQVTVVAAHSSGAERSDDITMLAVRRPG